MNYLQEPKNIIYVGIEREGYKLEITMPEPETLKVSSGPMSIQSAWREAMETMIAELARQVAEHQSPGMQPVELSR